MKKLLSFVSVIIISFTVTAQDKYVYAADLINIQDDKVSITLQTPAVKETEVIFSFPKVIPGSYSEKNYGKYIDDFTAANKSGKKLKVKKINANQYLISNATSLAKISYKVNDTWDTPEKDFIFQPGGSNIEAGRNVIMNNHAFYGYLEGYRMLPFEITVSKPGGMYASTHLDVERKSEYEDVLIAKNYVYLADNPVFYCVPDTASFLAGKSTIYVSVFSATGKINSAQIADYLKPMAKALTGFFNGLPVSSYQFLLYFEETGKALTGKENGGGGYGALEHNYSSLYFLPEIAYEPRLKSMVNDVTSHEFLHILTPLNLHSEEIEDFDFVNPKMSKHLWLYEGVTEYFSQLVQVQNGIFTRDEFFDNMREKINDSEKFGNFSMTEMSSHVLEPAYEDKYSSVYSKGAVTAFMLDIFIREKTGNAKDLKSVIVALTKKYGAGKAFKDDELFSEIVQLSHPDVQQFIDNYIAGALPLPYTEMFNIIGYEYLDVKKIDTYFIGNMALKFDEINKTFVFADVDKNALGIKNGDVFVSIDGMAVNSETVDKIWENYFKKNKDKTAVVVTVNRDGTEKELSGTLYKGYRELKNNVEALNTLSQDQTNNLNKLINL